MIESIEAVDQINLIEYTKTDDGWKPHSVIKDNSIYDFDWCPSRSMLCFNMSGGGGLKDGAGISKFVDAPNICGKIWIADGFKVYHDKTELKTKQQFRELGYQRIDKPLEIDGSIDPFEYADADETTEYCKFCGRLPSDNTCNHIWYDEYNGGFLNGCGSQELSFACTRKSLFRLFRFLSSEQLDKLYANPTGIFCKREFDWEPYASGIHWLDSLDEKTEEPNTLTKGWIYEYRESHGNRIASPDSTLWIDLPKGKLDRYLEIDAESEVRESLTVRYPRKVESAHDKFFNESPREITEVILKPKTKNWQSERVMNIAVRDVEIKGGKATISFSYFIKKADKQGYRAYL